MNDDVKITIGPYRYVRQGGEIVGTTSLPEIAQHDPGAKLDSGKAPLVWLKYFGRSLGCVADLTRQGALKYSPGGFLEVPDAYDRYTSAMLRHWIQGHTEEYVSDDPEWIKEVLHDTAVAWNALARLEVKLIEKEKQQHARQTTAANYPDLSRSLQSAGPGQTRRDTGQSTSSGGSDR